jgi:hypothetical protein
LDLNPRFIKATIYVGNIFFLLFPCFVLKLHTAQTDSLNLLQIKTSAVVADSKFIQACPLLLVVQLSLSFHLTNLLRIFTPFDIEPPYSAPTLLAVFVLMAFGSTLERPWPLKNWQHLNGWERAAICLWAVFPVASVVLVCDLNQSILWQLVCAGIGIALARYLPMCASTCACDPVQGCQIFLGTTYQNRKTYTK